MLESPLSWILTASRNVKVSFLQGFFERAARVDEDNRRVAVNVTPFNAPIVLKLLLEVGAYPLASKEPTGLVVTVDDAARVPLFSPLTSRKHAKVLSLAKVPSGEEIAPIETKARAVSDAKRVT